MVNDFKQKARAAAAAEEAKAKGWLTDVWSWVKANRAPFGIGVFIGAVLWALVHRLL